ncbi:MAG: hypothetical protein ACLTR6_16240 [Clostridium fessum]
MRYTEARLQKFAEEVYLKDLDKTVPTLSRTMTRRRKSRRFCRSVCQTF